MTDEATQEGVEKVELVAAHEERLNVIEAIASANSGETEETTEEEVVSEEGPEETEEVEGEPEEQEARKRTLKVDGQEVEKTEDEIIEAGIRALQKESTADKRLEEATRLLNEAKEQSQNLQPPQEDVATTQEQPSFVDAETMHKIQYGTQEEAQAALNQVIHQAVSQNARPIEQPQVNVSAVVNEELERRDMLTKLQTEFSDVFEDQRLVTIARLEIDQKIAGGETPTYDTYQEVLSSVRDWRGTQQDTGMEERKERKQKVTKISTASGVKPGRKKRNQKPRSLSSKRWLRREGN